MADNSEDDSLLEGKVKVFYDSCILNKVITKNFVERSGYLIQFILHLTYISHRRGVESPKNRIPIEESCYIFYEDQ